MFPIKAPHKAHNKAKFPNKLAKEVEPAWLHPNMHFQVKPSPQSWIVAEPDG